MKPGGAWMAPALRVVGLVAVAGGVLLGGRWAVLAAVGGVVAAFGLTISTLVRFRRSRRPTARPTDFAHTLDLLRRAHGATAAWAVGLREGDLEVVGEDGLPRHARDRGAALVQLASVDGRAHVAREPEGAYVAVGDFPFGAGLLVVIRGDAPPVIMEAVTDDLRRLVAGMRLAELEVPEGHGALVAKQLAAIAAGAQTLEGTARAGAEIAQQLAQRGAVIVAQDPVAGAPRVVAVSTTADRRLLGFALASEAPASRAIQAGVPVVTQRGEDVLGPGVPERRRHERAGVAYPLLDGHVPVGALVLLGAAPHADSPSRDRLARLVAELGPRLAAARAVHEAERRAVRDPLTGLANRREFERVLERYRAESESRREPATLIYADLDRFKALNDSLGHAAGDAALRHVAGVLEAQIRDGDMVARIGGEEFAVWLPRTVLEVGAEIAERIRHAVEGSVWRWNGTPYPLATSCGVAGYPDSVKDVTNLPGAADAALYRAKQGGRNRVEKARPSA